MSLKGKTLFITGASRGIGLAIALRAARDGAKTETPHPKLEGTIHSAAEAIEKAGGQALPLVVDVRDEAAATQLFNARGLAKPTSSPHPPTSFLRDLLGQSPQDTTPNTALPMKATRSQDMPRKVRDASLETRTARSRLPLRHKPFFRLI
jgi:short chain dehydrogenase